MRPAMPTALTGLFTTQLSGGSESVTAQDSCTTTGWFLFGVSNSCSLLFFLANGCPCWYTPCAPITAYLPCFSHTYSSVEKAKVGKLLMAQQSSKDVSWTSDGDLMSITLLLHVGSYHLVCLIWKATVFIQCMSVQSRFIYASA